MGNAHYDAANRDAQPVWLTKIRAVPTTGQTLVIPDTVHRVLIDPVGTLPTLTLKMPLKPFPDQEVAITFSQAITTLTVQANTGQTFIGTPPASAAIGTVVTYTWSASDSKWWPK